MRTQVTPAIVLSRLNYGEADRIITFLTPDHGKLKLMAKGVRREKSKVAGAVELFCETNVTYIAGKKDIGTLVSARLTKYYSLIVQELDRVQLGYECLKNINRFTEDEVDQYYFNFILKLFDYLNDNSLPTNLVNCWFKAQLIKQSGQSPQILTDQAGKALDPKQKFQFDFEQMHFYENDVGSYNQQIIKLIRILFSDNDLHTINRIEQLPANLNQLNKFYNQLFEVTF